MNGTHTFRIRRQLNLPATTLLHFQINDATATARRRRRGVVRQAHHDRLNYKPVSVPAEGPTKGALDLGMELQALFDHYLSGCFFS